MNIEIPSQNESRLARRLAAGEFAVTAEITPPVDTNPTQVLAKAEALRGLVDAINVTDGARGKVHMANLAAAAILAREGFEPVLQMTCRDRNRIALEADLLGAWAFGIRNVMFLRGDDPPSGIDPAPKAVFDMDSVELMRLASDLGLKGETAAGNSISTPPRFLIGGADLPNDPDVDWKPAALLAKANAGARFVQTQFCFDLGVIERYAARLADFDLTGKLGLIVGIGPIASANSARWMRDHLFGTRIPDDLIVRLEDSADQRAEGIKVCAELIDNLAKIKGVAGAHLMSPTGRGITRALQLSQVVSNR